MDNTPFEDMQEPLELRHRDVIRENQARKEKALKRVRELSHANVILLHEWLNEVDRLASAKVLK